MKKKTSELLKSSFVEMAKDLATSTPGHIIAFDPDTQLAQVQIGIVRVVSTGDTFEPAPIVECPVYFAGGSSFMLEHQIDPDDEGVVLFSQRCIDGWRETGGVAQQPIIRHHDMNDAMFMPGMRSKPNALAAFENDGIRIRNANGDAYVWLKSDGSVEIVSTSLTHNGVNVGATHTHTFVGLAPGTAGVTGLPVPTP